MPETIRNDRISLQVDLPGENYQQSRFDWTGKVTRLDFDGISMAGHELPSGADPTYGQGFYNEFGMDQALGFAETPVGDWFHKIGIGLLQKKGRVYDFQKPYNILPATFEVVTRADQVTIICKSAQRHGYAYVLTKTIQLQENGFVIVYDLKNTGEKRIATQEYAHNFITIHDLDINPDYALEFPFGIDPSLFIEHVNPEKLVNIEHQEVRFRGSPRKQFFFSNLSGDRKVTASWRLVQHKHQVGISETGSFETQAINLWGWGHVISPELFINIDLGAGQSTTWSRTYHCFHLGTASR